jgi:GYD domain
VESSAATYYAFGEYDAVIITELPDNVSAASLLLAAAGGGALKALKTTVLMSVEEGIEAMRRASRTGDRPPGSSGMRPAVSPTPRRPAVHHWHRGASHVLTLRLPQNEENSYGSNTSV